MIKKKNLSPVIIQYKIKMDKNKQIKFEKKYSELNLLQYKQQEIIKVTTDGKNLLFILLSKFSLYIHDFKHNNTYLMAEPRPNPHGWIGKLMTKRIFLLQKKAFDKSIIVNGYVRDFEKKNLDKYYIPQYLRNIIIDKYGVDIFLFIGYNKEKNQNMKVAYSGLLRCYDAPSNQTFSSHSTGLQY